VTGRIPILDVHPHVACGRYPACAVVGELVEVRATVFREGHDAVNASVALHRPDGSLAERVTMAPGTPGTDAWSVGVRADEVGMWSYSVEGWSDPMATWVHTAETKLAAEIDVDLVLLEGTRLLRRAAENCPADAAEERDVLLAAAEKMADDTLETEQRYGEARSSRVDQVMAQYPLRDLVTTEGPFDLLVERPRALFGSWYEMFPRSEGAVQDADGSWRSGTFATAARRLPAIAHMGFDVVYLPPIHPIGRSHRKGPNNTLLAGPDDPGVPWAIGSPEGGHDAVHPDLGTIADFDSFVAEAERLGLEVALDLALQASPDHPWVSEHPDWFEHRADGTIAYAENPPKKYQDIYPLSFDHDRDGIYAEVLRVVRHWVSHGVKIFRVDNPHTKPVNFWHWLIGEVRTTDPDVIFLAEAFTRPAMMHTLAKVGFQQSYTYFTWRNTRQELTEYALELAEAGHYMRPNFFVNTPDILPTFLQYGGPPAFKIRAALAATLSPTWGVYAGYELYEHVALKPGGEEYLDSEKYQYRPRDWAAFEPGGAREGESLSGYLGLLNGIRRAHPALQQLRHLHFHDADNPDVIVFSKHERPAGEPTDIVIVVVNLDPHGTRESTITLDMPALGMDWHDSFAAHDEVTDQTWHWRQHNYVRLDPFHEPAHIIHVRPWGH
jgi:starch synthase (maltosyl-transferring)